MSDTGRNYPTRMHEVLGMEAMERVGVKGIIGLEFWLDEYGSPFVANHNIDATNGDMWAIHLILHPDHIIRKPRLTGHDIAVLKALIVLGYKDGYVAKDSNGTVRAFKLKPCKGVHYWDGFDEQAGVLCGLDFVSWSDPAPLDIVQTLRDAGIEIEGESK